MKEPIVKLTVLDHEHEYSVEPKNYDSKELEVEVIGRLLDETPEIYVIGNWTSQTNSDVYRILKKCVTKKRYLK